MNVLGKIRTAAALLMACLSVVFAPLAYADGGAASYNEAEIPKIILDYFDDSEKTIPVVGAEFEVYKIADVVSDVTVADDGYGTADGNRVEPVNAELAALLNGYQKSHSTESAPLYKMIEAAKKAGIEPLTGKTGEDGIMRLNTKTLGVFVGVEVKPVEWHLASTPFLVEIPYTADDKNTGKQFLSYEQHVEAKAEITGHVSVTKKVKESSGDLEFSFRMTANKGKTFRAKLPDGKIVEVASGHVFKLKANDTATVYDVPTGTTITFEEIAMPEGWYAASGVSRTFVVEGKKVTEITFTNGKKRTEIPFGIEDAGFWPIGLVMMTGVAAIAAVCAAKKKQNKN